MQELILYQSPMERYLSIIKAIPFFTKKFIIDNNYDKALYSYHVIDYRLQSNKDITPRDIARANQYANEFVQLSESPTLYRITQNLNKARYNRSTKLKDEITKLFSLFPCSFVTLTFSDTTLNKCSLETLKKYVKRYLKSQCKYYIANVDYGRKNERIHFHAVVASQEIDLAPWRKYGAINISKIALPVGCSLEVTDCYLDEKASKIGKYISKLTNHAIKETAKANYVMYSEGLKELNRVLYYNKIKATPSFKTASDLFEGYDIEIIV